MTKMEIVKAVMTTDGPTLRMSVPIAKVDTENRVVSGFATLDNVDQHGDVVTAEASTKAFARFRGNLREMHAPIAVGKVLKFDEVEFYDAESDQIYRGVFVDAFVSRGAEDTWQKVLDGTLSGFSIGGKVLADENKVVKSANKEALVRHITDYELLELSLVDSPANQFANVLSITKSVEGATILKGIAVDVNLENILYCANDKVAVTTDNDKADCATCGGEMKNIGWVESQASDKVDKIRTAVAKEQGKVVEMNKTITYANFNTNGTTTTNGTITPTTTTSSTNGGYYITINATGDAATIAKQVQESIKTLEGGVDAMPEEKKEEVVATETVATTTETTEEPKAAEVEEVTPTEEAPAVEGEEKAAEVEEVAAEEVDLAKMFGEFAAEIKAAVTSANTETAEVVKSVQAEVTAAVSAVEAKVSELETKFSAMEENVAKRVDAVEGETAFKKSADLGGSGEKIEKKESIWGGRFLNANVTDII